MSQLTQSKKTVETLLQGPQFRDAITKCLPTHLSPDRFTRIALTAMTKTPKLRECTQESLFECLLQLSSLGLEPDGRRAHLIPYGTKCTLIIDWKGLAELAMRSGFVSSLHADVVCENDDFEYDRGQVIRHKVDLKEARGKVYAAYAIARFKDGTEKADAMGQDEIEAIRKRSRSGSSGPWVTDWNEMAKKTVFRRLSKWLPLSPEFRDALEAEEEERAFEAAKPVFAPTAPGSFLHPPTPEALPEPEAPTDGTGEEMTKLERLQGLLENAGISIERFTSHLRSISFLGAATEIPQLSDKKLDQLIAGFEATAEEIQKEDATTES